LRVILREVFAVRGVGRRRRMLAGRDANRPVIELPSHYDQSAIAREFLFFARITLCEPV
jgi:hypothetical protein